MGFSAAHLPAVAQIAIFVASGVTILLAGSRMAFLADRIADQTGFGEAITGAVLLGASTSLAGSITSIWTAWQGFPSLAYSNAIGGIAVQTVFLVCADLADRRVNLEHAAADLSNLVNGTVLIALLAVILAASVGPDITVFKVNPASFVIFGGYLYGLHLARAARDSPMWRVTQTRDTRNDRPDDLSIGKPLMPSLRGFLVCLVIVGIAGLFVAQTAEGFVTSFGLSQSIVGTLLTSVTTSLPELVTTLAAVRAGSLQLAIGGIVGGNAFDTLFASFSDFAYRDGSIYHALSRADLFLTAIVICMTGVLVLGMLRRQRRGPGGIGFEGWTVVALYGIGVAGVVLTG